MTHGAHQTGIFHTTLVQTLTSWLQNPLYDHPHVQRHSWRRFFYLLEMKSASVQPVSMYCLYGRLSGIKAVAAIPFYLEIASRFWHFFAKAESFWRCARTIAPTACTAFFFFSPGETTVHPEQDSMFGSYLTIAYLTNALLLPPSIRSQSWVSAVVKKYQVKACGSSCSRSWPGVPKAAALSAKSKVLYVNCGTEIKSNVRTLLNTSTQKNVPLWLRKSGQRDVLASKISGLAHDSRTGETSFWRNRIARSCQECW